MNTNQQDTVQVKKSPPHSSDLLDKCAGWGLQLLRHSNTLPHIVLEQLVSY